VDNRSSNNGHCIPIPQETDETAREIVDASLAVHKELGPGLLESVYETCLAHELTERGRRIQRQVALPVLYKGIHLDASLRLDLIVDEAVIVELKAIQSLEPVHTAQLLTYLKISGYRLGLLINFNVRLIRDGIKRLAM